MKPLKFKEVVVETARRSGQPFEVTEVLLRLYFEDLRSALTSLSYPNVQVLNLGTFSLKPEIIRKKFSRKRELLEKLLAASKRTLVQKELEKEIVEMENVLKIIEREKERKFFIKNNNNLDLR